MITVNGKNIKIEGTLGEAMGEAVQIVDAIKDIAWNVIDNEEDPNEANDLIKELSKWAADIIDAIMPNMQE